MRLNFRGLPRSTLLYVLAGFLLVASAATWQFGPGALFLVLIAAGRTLIVTGIRNRTGWPRPLLIIAGAVLMLSPLRGREEGASSHQG